MDSADSIARALAARQHGVVARRQLRERGATRGALRNLTGPHGRWVAITDEVLRLNGSPHDDEQTVMAAVLDAGPGATLCALAAAAWWGLRGCPIDPVHVARVGSTRRTSSLCVVHRPRFLPQQWTTEHRGVPVVRPELLALQLFVVCTVERAETLADRLWSNRLFSGRSLQRFLRDTPPRGLPGSAALRRYFEPRGVGYRPPDSGLESRFDKIAKDAGFELRRQVDSGDDEYWTGRVDFRHATLPLIVEIQSEAYHSSLVDTAADATRMETLRAGGFVVVEIADTTVWTRPDAVVAALRDGVRRARRQAGRRRAR